MYEYRIAEQHELPSYFYGLRLGTLECKHVVSRLNSDIYKASLLVGYKWVVLGSHRSGSLLSEEQVIAGMAQDGSFNRPVRLVWASDGRLWVDNTHTSLAYMRRYGVSCRLWQVPFYVVDTRGHVLVVYQVRGAVDTRLDSNVQALCAASMDVQQRVLRSVRPTRLKWSLFDLACEFENVYTEISRKGKEGLIVPIIDLAI